MDYSVKVDQESFSSENLKAYGVSLGLPDDWKANVFAHGMKVMASLAFGAGWSNAKEGTMSFEECRDYLNQNGGRLSEWLDDLKISGTQITTKEALTHAFTGIRDKKLRAEMQAHLEQCETWAANEVNLRTKVNDKNQKITEQEHEINTLKGEKAELEKKVSEGATNEETRSKINSLSEQIKKKDDEIGELTTNCSGVTAMKNQVESELKALKETSQKTGADLATAKSELSRKKDEVKKLQEKIDSGSGDTSKISSLEAEIQGLKGEKENLEKTVEEKSVAYSSINSQLNEARKKIGSSSVSPVISNEEALQVLQSEYFTDVDKHQSVWKGAAGKILGVLRDKDDSINELKEKNKLAASGSGESPGLSDKLDKLIEMCTVHPEIHRTIIDKEDNMFPLLLCVNSETFIKNHDQPAEVSEISVPTSLVSKLREYAKLGMMEEIKEAAMGFSHDAHPISAVKVILEKVSGGKPFFPPFSISKGKGKGDGWKAPTEVRPPASLDPESQTALQKASSGSGEPSSGETLAEMIENARKKKEDKEGEAAGFDVGLLREAEMSSDVGFLKVYLESHPVAVIEAIKGRAHLFPITVQILFDLKAESKECKEALRGFVKTSLKDLCDEVCGFSHLELRNADLRCDTAWLRDYLRSYPSEALAYLEETKEPHPRCLEVLASISLPIDKSKALTNLSKFKEEVKNFDAVGSFGLSDESDDDEEFTVREILYDSSTIEEIDEVGMITDEFADVPGAAAPAAANNDEITVGEFYRSEIQSQSEEQVEEAMFQGFNPQNCRDRILGLKGRNVALGIFYLAIVSGLRGTNVSKYYDNFPESIKRYLKAAVQTNQHYRDVTSPPVKLGKTDLTASRCLTSCPEFLALWLLKKSYGKSRFVCWPLVHPAMCSLISAAVPKEARSAVYDKVYASWTTKLQGALQKSGKALTEQQVKDQKNNSLTATHVPEELREKFTKFFMQQQWFNDIVAKH